MYLLDTNVISELRKIDTGRTDPHVAAWAAFIPTPHLYLSVIVIQELEMGILLKERKDPAQGHHLRVWLEQRLLPAFAGRILPVTLEVARRCATLNVPQTRPEGDGLIAATALVHGLTVVTRNTSDFADMGLSLLNPWEYPAT